MLCFEQTVLRKKENFHKRFNAWNMICWMKIIFSLFLENIYNSYYSVKGECLRFFFKEADYF